MPKLPKGYHNNIVCSNCGSDYASSGWYRTYDKDENWDLYEKKYHCAKCHTYFNPNTGKFSKSFKSPDLSKKLEFNFIDSDIVQLRRNKKRIDHKNTICSKCGSNYTSNHWYKKYDKNEIWDGTYICVACYANPAYRLGELNPNSNTYIGIIGERTAAKILGYSNCILMRQGSSFDIDTKKHIYNKYGKIKVKTSTYHPIYKRWVVGGIKPGFFDTLFTICTDKEFENIERVYIIPGYEVNMKNISIIKNLSRGGWYEEFRVNDIKPYQEAFRIVKNEIQISKNYVYNGESLSSTKEKGDICEWIVEETKRAKISIDISYDLIHKKYKRIEVKGSNYRSRHKKWHIGDIQSYKFDTLFIVCMSSNFERVERIYIIPNNDVDNRTNITILKNPPANAWYNKFRVDEKPYQKTYERILKGEIN